MTFGKAEGETSVVAKILVTQEPNFTPLGVILSPPYLRMPALEQWFSNVFFFSLFKFYANSTYEIDKTLF